MRLTTLVSTMILVPGLLAAQAQDPVERLRQVLPADVADQVIAIVSDATSRGLPGDAVAERALEASAKGRSGAEVSAAARSYATQLDSGRDALRSGGHTPDGSEIESAAGAMKAGVDGKAISELAKSAPLGRSLTVPIAVLTALLNRGLPSDAALQAVHDRLVAKAADRELLDMPGAAGRLIAEGHRPADVGRELGASRGASGQAPGGPPVSRPSQGPPSSVPSNNGKATGRPANPGNH
jgi:hypothetical protein